MSIEINEHFHAIEKHYGDTQIVRFLEENKMIRIIYF